MKRILLRLSGEHLELAVAEAKSIIMATKWVQEDSILTAEVESTDQPWQRLAFTKEVFEFIVPKQTTQTLRIDNYSSKETSGVRKELLEQFKHPPINLENPDMHIGVFDQGIGKRLWKNTENFNERKSHNRPMPHPTALHPKLARAMINLSGAKKNILDPFCGAGGILLEASLLELSSTGVDIDKIMIKRAQENLKHCSSQIHLHCQDALTYTQQAEVIVSDLPYGKNSKMLQGITNSFLKHAHSLTTIMVISVHEPLEITHNWVIKQSFEWRLHKSLTKYLYVLHSSAMAR